MPKTGMKITDKSFRIFHLQASYLEPTIQIFCVISRYLNKPPAILRRT